jgi:hypothetical protein
MNGTKMHQSDVGVYIWQESLSTNSGFSVFRVIRRKHTKLRIALKETFLQGFFNLFFYQASYHGLVGHA